MANTKQNAQPPKTNQPDKQMEKKIPPPDFKCVFISYIFIYQVKSMPGI